MYKKITILIFIFFLSGCSMSPFTGERMSTLKVGMSDTEALSVAGKYDSFTQLNKDTIVYKYLNRYISGWGNSFTNYYLVFNNHKLTAIETDKPWVDNTLSENLARMNDSIQKQALIDEQRRANQMEQFNRSIEQQNQLRQIQQNQYYQNRQLELDQERNRQLQNLNNTLLFGN